MDYKRGRDLTSRRLLHLVAFAMGGSSINKEGGGILSKGRLTHFNDDSDRYNGIYQFHPSHKDEFCSEIYASLVRKPPNGEK